MTPKRAAAWTLVAALAAAWFASAAGVIGPARAPRIPRPSQHPAQTDAVSFDLQAQTERLRKRLATAPSPQPVRNPFVFAVRQPVEVRSPRRAVPPPPPDMAPLDVEPQLRLIGIAENGTGDALVRTAMIADGDELLLVRLGQAVAGRYTVAAIGSDAVELKDVTNDRVRRLGLQ
jgi:hypothetical protein